MNQLVPYGHQPMEVLAPLQRLAEQMRESTTIGAAGLAVAALPEMTIAMARAGLHEVQMTLEQGREGFWGPGFQPQLRLTVRTR